MSVRLVPVAEHGSWLLQGWDLVAYERFGSSLWAVVARREMRVREVHS